jgi:hypothetical protein
LRILLELLVKARENFKYKTASSINHSTES